MAESMPTRMFGWQGLRLRVPEDWELGRVDGDAASGYARLDDAAMVRAEVEWRDAPVRGARRPVSDLVDRYIANLEKKADKTGVEFRTQRHAKFLRDKTWLEGSEYEAFIWEADYRAYNVARACPDCHRVVLARVLGKPGEDAEALVNEVLPSLEDHPRPEDREGLFWSVYGLTCRTPPGFALTENDLKSGHIKLTFEADRGARSVRIHRLSMAQMLLRDRDLADWFPDFFRKDLRDVRHEITEHPWRGHAGVGRAGPAAAGGRSCAPCRWSTLGPAAITRGAPGTAPSRTASASSSTSPSGARISTAVSWKS